MVCAGSERVVFAASRGTGRVLSIDPDRLQILGETKVGPKPNGLAWDGNRRQLLVADVDPSDQAVRAIRVSSMEWSPARNFPIAHAGVSSMSRPTASWSTSGSPHR